MATFGLTLQRAFSPSPKVVVAHVVPPAVMDIPLDAIAIFRAEAVTEAWTERNSTRPSDKLNRGVRIDVRYSRDGAAHPLETDDVIALAVQVQPNPSPNRIARRRHVLEMTAGPYRLRGIVHMPPGADPSRYLRAASQRWIALTDATIVTGDGNDDGYEIDALLVNMEHVTRA